jgi:hypothetical protein
MTINIKLTPELEQRLKQEAERRQLSPDQCAADLLEERLLTADRNAQAIAVLQSFIDDGDEQEQRETYEFLTKALDEDRPSERKLFPPELKGITW